MSVYNHLLFSEMFFRQVRSETTDLDNLRATLSTIRDTWQYYLPPLSDGDDPDRQSAPLSPLDDVTQLRANVVEPIFAYLQLTYGPCETDERTFFLYADWDRQDRTGLCLVLPYSADIEGRDPKTGIIPKGRNHAQQLIHLLRKHDLDWGVLTNGRHWRLFHRRELSPTETYLHVDLERIIADDDIENYIAFHRFFSRSAFVRSDDSPSPSSGEDQGMKTRLDLYKQQSDEATKIIEDHLSAHVEEIVRQLCQGLVESCRAAGEDVTAPEIRSAIYKNALFLIYRLLFVLYAEARDLLPLDAPTYQEVCLRDLLAEVRDNHKHGMHYDDDYAMWDRLQSLFALIDQGDPAAGVPAYNGGLFDPGRRPFLSQHRVRNDYLQAALIRLSTVPARGKTYDQDRTPQPIDYRDLSVRHLGSLYEGLLEYSLFVVEDEPRVVRVSKKKTRYVPYSQAGKVRATETVLQVGDVYFSETAGERKATGSYYTPEDVVDYIVRHTVGEKLNELKAEFSETQQIERQLADLADTPPDIPAHRQIQQALDEQALRFVREKVLDLKILDPAMGSGHFLVNATHAVANFIVELLNETPWENREIDTDVATWKRYAAERCIFGVDLNELAVELAKLCLWMTTAAKGRPLTFLDHHLRWGNSLVGAWLEDVGTYPLVKKESDHAFTLPMGHFKVQLDQVLAGYQELYAKSSDDVDEVREKARIFDKEICPILQPFRELLDLHTGVYFGNGLDQETYAQLGDAVRDSDKWTRLKTKELSDLLAQYADRRWFHWELGFPEVFTAERGGFDVVVGNPPYVGQLANTVQQRVFETARCGNLYAWFIERALQVTGNYVKVGLIVPLSLMFSNRMKSLRSLLLRQQGTLRLASFDNIPDCIFNTGKESSSTNRMNSQRTTILVIDRAPGPLTIETTPLLRWLRSERAQVFPSLRFVDATPVCNKQGFAMIGEENLVAFLQRLQATNLTIENLVTDEVTQYKLFVPTKARYFIPASPEDLQRRNQMVLTFPDEESYKYAFVLISSNVFYWHWRVFGDGFDVTLRDVLGLPLPSPKPDTERLGELAAKLRAVLPECRVTKLNAGKLIANLNFNKRIDVLLEIDNWIVSLVAPGLELPRDVFAQSKSNSFLRPLEIALGDNREEREDDET